MGEERWSVGPGWGGLGPEWWVLLGAAVSSLMGATLGLWEWAALGDEGRLGRRHRELLLVLAQAALRLRDRLLPFVLQGQAPPEPPDAVPEPSASPATAPALCADETPVSSLHERPAPSKPNEETALSDASQLVTSSTAAEPPPSSCLKEPPSSGTTQPPPESIAPSERKPEPGSEARTSEPASPAPEEEVMESRRRLPSPINSSRGSSRSSGLLPSNATQGTFPD